MNLNRLRLGQKSRKKNYKIKPCQNDIIKCNCDNLHTFIHILYYVLCKITYTFTDVKRNLSTRTGTWTRDLQTAPRTLFCQNVFCCSGDSWPEFDWTIWTLTYWRYFGWMKFENLHFALEFTKSFWFFKNHKYSVQPRFPLLCCSPSFKTVHGFP